MTQPSSKMTGNEKKSNIIDNLFSLAMTNVQTLHGKDIFSGDIRDFVTKRYHRADGIT